MKTAFAALPIVALLVAGSDPAQQPIRSRIQGVRIDAIVTDHGRPVTGLEAKDFEVLDNGAPQRLESGAAAGSVAAALVLDVSASVQFGHEEYPHHRRTTGQGFGELLTAARVIATALHPEDRASLLACADTMSMLEPSPAKNVLQALGAAEFEHPTIQHLKSTPWDAVFAAAATISETPGRPVVMLFSDGIDNASWLSQKATTIALQRLGIAVDFIGVERSYDTLDWVPPGDLEPEQIARDTGGEVFSARDAHLPDRLRARLDELRNGYILTYTPRGVGTNDGWHTLTVRLRDTHGTIKARKGYYTAAHR